MIAQELSTIPISENSSARRRTGLGSSNRVRSLATSTIAAFLRPRTSWFVVAATVGWAALVSAFRAESRPRNAAAAPVRRSGVPYTGAPSLVSGDGITADTLMG